MSTLSSLPGYDTLRYHVVPPVFLVVFTLLAQVLAVIGNPHCEASVFNLGSAFAWKVVLAFYAWAFASLRIPSKKFEVMKTWFLPLDSADFFPFTPPPRVPSPTRASSPSTRPTAPSTTSSPSSHSSPWVEKSPVSLPHYSTNNVRASLA